MTGGLALARAAVSLLAITLLLGSSGCGQRGPLYFAEADEEHSTTGSQDRQESPANESEDEPKDESESRD